MVGISLLEFERCDMDWVWVDWDRIVVEQHPLQRVGAEKEWCGIR